MSVAEADAAGNALPLAKSPIPLLRDFGTALVPHSLAPTVRVTPVATCVGASYRSDGEGEATHREAIAPRKEQVS